MSARATLFHHDPPAATPEPYRAPLEEELTPPRSFHPGIVMRPGDVLSVSAKAPKGGAARLEVSPRLAAFNPNGVPVRVQVRITAPAPELSCPEVAIEWPDGTHSTAEADCAPCEVAPCPDFESPARWRRFGAGEFDVRAWLRQGKKTVVLTERVTIAGGDQ